MKLYNPRQFQKLYDYKEEIQDEEIKQIITELIRNYNKMYIKLKDLLIERESKKENYKKLESLSIENHELKQRLDRYNRVIEDLRKRVKEAQKK